MQILPVRNYSPAFGYNKEANEQVNSLLEISKKHKHIAMTYLEANKFCMQTEDMMRKCDASGDKRTSETLKEWFVPMKSALTFAIDRMFPKRNYALKEYTTYKLEADKILKETPEDEDNWIVWMRDELDPDDDCGDEAVDFEQMAEPETEKSDASVSKLVELYSPNKWSPVGLDSLGDHLFGE